MSNSWLSQVSLASLLAGEREHWQVLAQEVRTWEAGAKLFGITPENVNQVVEERLSLLRCVFPDFKQLCENNLQIPTQTMLQALWDLWLPLGVKIASSRKSLGRPMIQGILGPQGTGKTTMCQILNLVLRHLGYSSLSLSLDDLYKTHSDRVKLREQDPRLIWRGPPGTHDIHLGLSLLDQILQNKFPVTVPRFDKSALCGIGDRTTPEIIDQVDIVLFEGWFVGVLPIDPETFTNAPAPIITPEDQAFARSRNQQLGAYVPLWQKIDSLIIIKPTDYRFSLKWRKEAEHKMIAAGFSGMNDAQIEEFVKYFWRSLHPELFMEPLIKSPPKSLPVDLVIEVKEDHSLSYGGGVAGQ